MMRNYRAASLTPADRAMLDYATKLTRTPGTMSQTDIQTLRQHAFSDAAIHHITQITALFNYDNRLADGLGIQAEPEWQSDPT